MYSTLLFPLLGVVFLHQTGKKIKFELFLPQLARHLEIKPFLVRKGSKHSGLVQDMKSEILPLKRRFVSWRTVLVFCKTRVKCCKDGVSNVRRSLTLALAKIKRLKYDPYQLVWLSFLSSLPHRRSSTVVVKNYTLHQVALKLFGFRMS